MGMTVEQRHQRKRDMLAALQAEIEEHDRKVREAQEAAQATREALIGRCILDRVAQDHLSQDDLNGWLDSFLKTAEDRAVFGLKSLQAPKKVKQGV